MEVAKKITPTLVPCKGCGKPVLVMSEAGADDVVYVTPPEGCPSCAPITGTFRKSDSDE